MQTNSTEVTQARFLRITALFWLVAKIISYKLWVTDRLFPIVSVFDSTADLPPKLHILLYIVSMVCLGLVVYKPNSRRIVLLLFCSELLSCFLDYHRWQPWEYQFLFILFISLFNKDEAYKINAYIFLMAGLYVYSGLHKLNDDFLVKVWVHAILEGLFGLQADRTPQWIIASGYSLGLLETIAGAGILWKRTQRACAIGLIAMHLFNLLLLGPFGLNYNIIVWPWNALMVFYLLLLFGKKSPYSFSLKPLFAGVNPIVLVCWGVFPAFNFWGYWDNYLSANLYSGTLPIVDVCFSEQHYPELLPFASKTDVICNGKKKVNLQSWALAELKVPPYPEERVYKKVARELKLRYPGVRCVQYHLKGSYQQ